MLNSIAGYWIEATGFDYLQAFTLGPLPMGSNVYANISLSSFDTIGNPEILEYSASASIESWTYYEPDGTQSPQQYGSVYVPNQNAVFVQNCATITFVLIVLQATASAQVNVFTL